MNLPPCSLSRARSSLYGLGVLFCMTLLTSCMSWMPHEPSQVYEYRYRVFEAEKTPELSRAPLSDSLTLQQFLPAAALNASMDQLSTEGFQLWRIRQIAGTHQYTFIFRRIIPEGFRPTHAPMEITGVYQAQPPANVGTYYAFEPRFKGYTIFIFAPGQDMPQMINADWDDAHHLLRAQVGGVENTFQLSADGLIIGHVGEQLSGDRLGRNITYLRRIQSGD